MNSIKEMSIKDIKTDFTQQDFIDKVNEQYHKAHSLMETIGDFDIHRGTAHPVSGYMEDVFAIYMAHRIGDEKLQFLVDKLISNKGDLDKKATTFKPDLAIIDQNVLTHYFDLKTNLGWNRDLNEYLIKKNNLIEKLKAKKGWITFPNISEEKPGKRQNITYSENLKYQIVVFGGWNINQDLLKENIKLAEGLNNVQMHILQTWDEVNKKLVLNQQAFDDLI